MKKIVGLTLVLMLIFSLASFAEGKKESGAPESITLVGGVMLPQGHVYYQAMEKFVELLDEYYTGPIELKYELHHSGSIGTEKDMFEFMMQGVSVDFAIISPAWVATWDKTAPIIDAPFLFKSIEHWEKSLEAGALDSIAETIRKKGVRFIGYGGGGARSLILNQPVKTLDDFGKIDLRVQGSPLHAAVFGAIGLNPTPLDYTECYNAIKTGVIDGLENEPAGLEGMKFYEVAPYYALSEHQITTRILCFSESRLQSFPQDLQDAIVKAGLEAGRWHRKTEVAMGQQIIDKLAANHGLKTIDFTKAQKDEMARRAMPEVMKYAKEVGATEIVEKIQNL